MIRQTRRLCLFVLEGIAVLLAIVAALVFYAHWKISHEGLSLPMVSRHVADLLGDQLVEGCEVRISDITLSREGEVGRKEGPLLVRADNLEIKGPDGETMLSLPSMQFDLRAGDLMRGKLRPRFIRIEDAQVTLRRDQTGQFNIGLSRGADAVEGPADAGTGDGLVDLIFSGENVGGRLFEGARLTGARMVFEDALTDQRWSASDVTTEVWQTARGYEAVLSAPFQVNDSRSDLSIRAGVDELAGEITVALETDGINVADLLTLGIGEEYGSLVDTVVGGQIDTVFDFDGVPLRSRINLVSNGGQIAFGERMVSFDLLDVATDYIPASRTFRIDELEYDVSGNAGMLEGYVSFGAPVADAPLMPERIDFDLAGRNLVLDLPGVTPAALAIPVLEAAGHHDLAAAELHIDSLSSDVLGPMIEGRVSILLPLEKGQSAGVIAEARMDGHTTAEKVMAAWPLVVADGARRWVARNLKSGKMSDIQFTMDMPRGMIRVGQGIGNDMMELRFSFEDVVAQYVPGMTPIRDGRGRAVVRGNSFSLTAESGRVNNVNLISGSVTMPKFYPKETRAEFRATVAGAVPDILAIVDEEPLGYISAAGFSPSQFSGTGQFEIEVFRPNFAFVPIEDYGFGGTGTFRDLGLADFKEGYDIANAVGDVALSTEGLTINATAEMEGAPTTITWKRLFGDEGETRINAEGTLNAAIADRFGISLRQFMRGDARYSVFRRENKSEGERIDLTIDLTPAELRVDALQFFKPTDVPGTLRVSVEPPDRAAGEVLWRYRDILLESQDISLSGNMTFADEVGLVFLEADRFFINGGIDAGLRLDRSGEDLALFVDGAYADLSGVIDAALNFTKRGKGPGLPGKLALDLKLAQATLKNAVSLADLDCKLVHDGEKLTSVNLSADFEAGGSVVAQLGQSNLEIGRSLNIETDNVEALSRGIFGLASLKGGSARYEATWIKDGPLVGMLSASDVDVVNAPLIARVLSAGSLTGLNDLLIGEGIEISDVKADIQYEDGELRIADARATGPSVGVSVNGGVNFASRQYDLNGAVAPAYGVNSMFGVLPGVGDLFVSREGEGIVAFSYGVSGGVDEPLVTVNALSLFTPGIFRRIFEPVRETRPSTDELLDEAVRAAEQQRINNYAATPEQLRELSESLKDLTADLPQ